VPVQVKAEIVSQTEQMEEIKRREVSQLVAYSFILTTVCFQEALKQKYQSVCGDKERSEQKLVSSRFHGVVWACLSFQ